jgi:hypothetical protein
VVLNGFFPIMPESCRGSPISLLILPNCDVVE